MKMVLLVVSWKVLVPLLFATVPQCTPLTDCDQLGFGPGAMPTSGTDLETCSTMESQCCSASNIASIKGVARDTLVEGLVLQLNKTSTMFSMTVERISNYFNSTFRMTWSDFFPNPGHVINNTAYLPELYNPIVNDLLDNLAINNNSQNFNASRLVQDIVETITQGAGNVISGGRNETLKTCAVQHLNNSISITSYYSMARLLETTQRCMISLRNVEQFLKQYVRNKNFKFPSNCIERLLTINFCDRCKGNIPPLCSNTCGALIRGCFSPYYSALRNQFDNVLWNVSIQLLEVLNTSLNGLFTEGQRLFNETMVEKLPRICGTAFQFPELVMSSNINQSLIPEERMLELREMIGRGLSYDEGGPKICQPFIDEQEFCTDGPSTERQNNCNITTFCTSTCNCYNGNMKQDTDTEQFKMNSTEDQMNNPVICLNCSELMEIRNAIKPVEDFFMMDRIHESLPNGVIVPQVDNSHYSCDGLSLKSVPVHILVSIGLIALCIMAS